MNAEILDFWPESCVSKVPRYVINVIFGFLTPVVVLIIETWLHQVLCRQLYKLIIDSKVCIGLSIVSLDAVWYVMSITNVL